MVKQVSAAAAENRPAGSASRGRARFHRNMRLLRHADFDRVYKQGRRHFAMHLTVFYRLREKGDSARVGFTVSKALGGAVERNRMRRRLREAVRLNWSELRSPVDIVVNPKKSVLKADFAGLSDEVRRALEVVRKFVEKQSI